MVENNTVYWVWMQLLFGPGNHRIWDILQHFGSVHEAFEELSAGNGDMLSEKERRHVRSVTLEQAQSVLDTYAKIGAVALTPEAPDYPARLKSIYNPPAVLYCIGDLSDLDETPALSVVGSREASPCGIRTTQRICGELAAMGFVIVSGFAVGIDSAAHVGALRAKGKTIAVLACGLDVDYPRPNAKAKHLIARHGAIVTEFLPGTRPMSGTFQVRNRLIAALSLGTLVAEARESSGALITVAHALEQGKDVFCIPPHDIYDKSCTGVVGLLRDGATAVYSSADIFTEYFDAYAHKLLPYQEALKESRQEHVGQNAPKEKLVRKAVDFSRFSPQEKAVLELLSAGEKSADDLCVEASMTAGEMLGILTDLEIEGAVEALSGQRYRLA